MIKLEGSQPVRQLPDHQRPMYQYTDTVTRGCGEGKWGGGEGEKGRGGENRRSRFDPPCTIPTSRRDSEKGGEVLLIPVHRGNSFFLGELADQINTGTHGPTIDN